MGRRRCCRPEIAVGGISGTSPHIEASTLSRRHKGGRARPACAVDRAAADGWALRWRGVRGRRSDHSGHQPCALRRKNHEPKTPGRRA